MHCHICCIEKEQDIFIIITKKVFCHDKASCYKKGNFTLSNNTFLSWDISSHCAFFLVSEKLVVITIIKENNILFTVPIKEKTQRSHHCHTTVQNLMQQHRDYKSTTMLAALRGCIAYCKEKKWSRWIKSCSLFLNLSSHGKINVKMVVLTIALPICS